MSTITPAPLRAVSERASTPVAMIAGLATIVSASMPIETAHAQFLEMMQIEVCNRDGDSQIAVAVVDETPETVGADGWTRIDPNSCRTIYRHTSSRTYHHVYFGGEGVGLMKLDFGAGYRGGTFCISSDAFEYSDTILSWGRSKKCRGSEKLEQSTYRVPGQTGGRRQIVINPFSAKKSAQDGKICLLGFCM